MTIEEISDYILEMHGDEVTDLFINEDKTEISCVWFKAIPMTGSFEHSLFGIYNHFTGFWTSRAPYLKPSNYLNYEEYLFEYAKVIIEDFYKFCLKVIPEKYFLSLDYTPFTYVNNSIFSLTDIQEKLKIHFDSHVSNIELGENRIEFILYETLCFKLELQNEKIVLIRVMIDNVNICILRRDKLHTDIHDLLGYINQYCQSILPDEWLQVYATN